jgi:hypothetical protein
MSAIYEIEGSPWVAERIAHAHRMSEEVYRRPLAPFAPRHFVVKGHDIYHEILADGFKEARIERATLTDRRLLALLGNG